MKAIEFIWSKKLRNSKGKIINFCTKETDTDKVKYVYYHSFFLLVYKLIYFYASYVYLVNYVYSEKAMYIQKIKLDKKIYMYQRSQEKNANFVKGSLKHYEIRE